MTPEQYIFDEIISSALDVLRVSAQQRAEIFERLAKLEKELVAKLSERNFVGNTRRQVEAFIKKNAKEIDKAFSDIAGVDDASQLATAVAEDTKNVVHIALGGRFKIKNVPAAYLKSVASEVLIQGAPSADWWRGQAQDLKTKFAAQVRQGLLAAETNQQIIARIVGKSGEPGIMETARRNAAALVQSSVQTVANDARRKTFEANSDFIKGLKQVSTLDSHTTIICVSYSGAQWNLKKEPINGNKLPYKTGTPRHWGCRSVEVPITKTFKELGLDIPEPTISTRASEVGQVSANTSFDAFLKRRGKAYQDDVLGVGRAELWRAGKITLSDLVNGAGNPLTLAQLQAKVARRKR